jgi:hypothetical protein
MSRTKKLLTFLAATALAPCLLVAAGPASAADETFGISRVIAVPGGLNAFDISFVDPGLAQYFLADRTNASIDVVPTDTTTTTVKQQFKPGFVGVVCVDTSVPPKVVPCSTPGAKVNNDLSGPNGVLVANEEFLWVGDGPQSLAGGPVESHVWVLDVKDGTKVATISTGGKKRADELCFDPQHHLILVANDADDPPFVTFISSASFAVLGTIKMDGNNGTPKATNGIEQCQWSPRTKKFYLNIPEVGGDGNNSKGGVVLEINPASMKIEKTFPISHDLCTGPQGMAIGPDRQILLGCANQTNDSGAVVFAPGSVIIDELTGGVVHGLPGLGGMDEVWFNPGDNQYFLAGGNHVATTPSPAGSNPILGVVDVVADQPGTFKDANAPSASGSHSVAADPVHNQVYVPANKAAMICGSLNGQGCIAVFTATGGDDKGICVAQGSPVVAAGEAGPVFLRAVCP